MLVPSGRDSKWQDERENTQEITTESGCCITPEGVAGDVRSTRLDSIAGYMAYVPERMMQRLPILQIVPMQDKVAAAAATPRFFTTLVSVFGALALMLAAVGLYGIVAYVVRQREREIGVRVALGATPAHVVWLMLRRGMRPVLAGLTVGIALALFATRLLRSLLYEVSASDPVTFVGVATLLAAVALVASWLPSRRAARVDPTVTLRAD